METTDVRITIAGVDDICRIATAYAAWGYSGGITPEDTAWLAEISGNVVGTVRIAPEHGTLVLRGMQVAEQWRGLGLGTRLLHAVASWLDNRRCYCIPYAHLEPFYGQAGFRRIPGSAAPPFLADRTAHYTQRGLDVRIMVRSFKDSHA
jgi:GNAT superfamily N-acetyltransferase